MMCFENIVKSVSLFGGILGVIAFFQNQKRDIVNHNQEVLNRSKLLFALQILMT